MDARWPKTCKHCCELIAHPKNFGKDNFTPPDWDCIRSKCSNNFKAKKLNTCTPDPNQLMRWVIFTETVNDRVSIVSVPAAWTLSTNLVIVYYSHTFSHRWKLHENLTNWYRYCYYWWTINRTNLCTNQFYISYQNLWSCLNSRFLLTYYFILFWQLLITREASWPR